MRRLFVDVVCSFYGYLVGKDSICITIILSIVNNYLDGLFVVNRRNRMAA